jgi:hypothetical protein
MNRKQSFTTNKSNKNSGHEEKGIEDQLGISGNRKELQQQLFPVRKTLIVIGEETCEEKEFIQAFYVFAESSTLCIRATIYFDFFYIFYLSGD